MRWALFALFLLSACAALEPATEEAEFELAGRIAVRYGAEAFSGNLAWRHGAAADDLLLTTALGAGIARLTRNGQNIVLTTAEPREYKSNDPEALTQEVLGFRLPIRGLAEWVRGRPAPELEARGWKIEYQGYDAQNRPMRLRVTYPNLELRLAISEWK